MTTTGNPSRTPLADAAHRSSGSFELVLGPVIMSIIGLAVDSWFGTRPLFMLVFTLWGAFGAAAAIYFRYRHQVAQLSASQSRPGAEP